MSPNVFPLTKEPGKRVCMLVSTHWADPSIGLTRVELAMNLGSKSSKLNANSTRLYILQTMSHFNFNATIHTSLAFCGLLENNGCTPRAEKLFWNRAWQKEYFRNRYCEVSYPASETKDSFLMCSLGHPSIQAA